VPFGDVSAAAAAAAFAALAAAFAAAFSSRAARRAASLSALSLALFARNRVTTASGAAYATYDELHGGLRVVPYERASGWS